VRFRVLGPVEIESDDGQPYTLGRRQERCLLAILLLEAARIVPVDRLCHLLWDDNPPQQARRAVHVHVARIRAALSQCGAHATGVELVSHRDGYMLRVDPDAVDAHRFRRLLDQAADTTDLDHRDRLLHDALALWRGPALHNAAVSDRLRRRLCAGLDEQRLQAVEASIATGLDLGRHRQLLPELARLCAEHPVRERLVELHMRALYRHGRTAEALDVYHQARTRLADALGLDPGPVLQQLHQAILRGDPLPPTQVSPSPPSMASRVAPAQLPADLATFAGRVEQLNQLDTLLSSSATAVVISAIAGTAGIGKTALAVHWAHRVRDRFPDGQLYANLRGFDPAGPPTPPGGVIRRFLDALGVPIQRIPTDPDTQIDLYRSMLADKRILIVLDNARDPTQVRPLLPGAPGCLILVTSRNRLTGLIAIDGAHPLTLDLLTTDEARQLLVTRLGASRVTAEPDAVHELITLCARLPLALAIAAAHATSEPHRAVQDLVNALHDTRGTLHALSGDDPASSIHTVFACSYHALSREAARLFRRLGLQPGPDISAAAAASLAGIPPEQANPLLAELTYAHLLTEPTHGRYAFHDLLRNYANEQAHTCESDTECDAAIRRVLDHYLHTAHTADRLMSPQRDPITVASPHLGVTVEDITDHGQAMDWFTVEHPVLLAAIRQAAKTRFDTHTWQLSWTLANFLDRQGQWHDAVATQEAALEAAQRLADGPRQANTHRYLARAHLRLGRPDDAQAHLRHALHLYRELADHAGQAHTHLALAQLLDRQGRRTDALDQAQRALDLYQATGHRTGQANALNNVGWYHAQLGNHRQALTCCQQALTLNQELGDRYGEAGTWDSLGYAHHHLGHYTDAIICYQQAIDLYRDLGDRYYEAETLTRIGETHHTTGDPDLARNAWQHALTILNELDHPDADIVRAKLDSLQRAEAEPRP